jgi:hypothetical protein
VVQQPFRTAVPTSSRWVRTSSGVVGVALLGTLLAMPGSSVGRTISRPASIVGRAVTAATRPLPVPNPLTRDWTAPAGRFTMPRTVSVRGTATVDLSAAVVTGTTGYLFDLSANGANLTIVGGTVRGPITGLVRDSLPDASSATVAVRGTRLYDAHSLVFAPTTGGPISVTLDHVTATGLGDGIRATADAVDVTASTLTGGGLPPSGYPAGIHSLDDDHGNVAVPGSHINVFDSTIIGFTSTGFQGDSIIGETRVARADIEGNILGHNSDTGGVDSKMGFAVVRNNTIYSDGDRALAGHYGTLTSSGNTIYQVARTLNGARGKAYQGSGTLVASDDRVSLGTGAYLAQSVVVLAPASGPAATYPRTGQLSLTHIVDLQGNVIVGPVTTSSSGGETAGLVVNP